jgi:methionyl-tRNA formyltransferase
MSLKIVFAGTPKFAEIALRSLLNKDFSVLAVYTQPDRPAGRGMKLSASPVKVFSHQSGVTVKQPLTLRDTNAQAELAALRPDLMIVAAYGLILPQAVLDIPRLGCLNIHASLLPRWRGAAPIHRAILAGDRETGVAIMRMEAGLDTGAVLLEKRTPIHANDTTQTLHDRLANLGAEAMLQVLNGLERGEPWQETPQPSEGVTYAAKITPDEAMIDWAYPLVEIERAIRAFNPSPGAATLWRNERIKVWRASSTAAGTWRANSQPPGSLVFINRERLGVVCGDSGATGALLELDEIQRPGGKRVSVASWLSSSTAPTATEFLRSAP